MKLLYIFFVLLVILYVMPASAQQTVSTPAFRNEFLEYINQVRQKGCKCGTTFMPPAAPLVWNDQLEVAAIGHAKDMANKNYFSHTSKDGRTVDKRIIAAGYTYEGYKSYAIGENIAQGDMTIKQVTDGWFKSEGHCKNLMNPGFKEVGIAQHDDYWVQDLGGRESFSEEQQKLIKSGKIKLIEKH